MLGGSRQSFALGDAVPTRFVIRLFQKRSPQPSHQRKLPPQRAVNWGKGHIGNPSQLFHRLARVWRGDGRVVLTE
jgi:hypothetical protein